MKKTIIASVNLRGMKFKEIPSILSGVHIVGGNFYIGDNNLKNLKNSPSIVDLTFDCSLNKNLTSLVDGPKEVGSLNASNCGLTSLNGLPSLTKSTSSPYSPYNPALDLSGNNLTSLVGLPDTLKARLVLYNNPNLKTLNGCSKIINGDLEAVWLPIKNMIGGPKQIYGNLFLMETQIDSVEGFPEYVDGNVFLGDTPLWEKLFPKTKDQESLQNAKKLLAQLCSICEIEGDIYAYESDVPKPDEDEEPDRDYFDYERN